MIILEFTINCDLDWRCAKFTERLIHIINDKFSHLNLEVPAYMFIDLLQVGHFMMPYPTNNTRQGRIDRLNSFLPDSHAFNRGSVGRSYLLHWSISTVILC